MTEEDVRKAMQEGDIVFDPYMGSATTAVAALHQKRHYLGYELSEEYYQRALKRIEAEKAQLTLF